MNKEETIKLLRQLRETYETEHRRILDEHMSTVKDKSEYWRHTYRASIEMQSWPVWKRRACHSIY